MYILILRASDVVMTAAAPWLFGAGFMDDVNKNKSYMWVGAMVIVNGRKS